MTEPVAVAAVDLGATSGRVMVVRVAGAAVSLETVHRFDNVPVRLPDGLHWNVLDLYRNVLTGVRRVLAAEPALASVGIDSWAVDYGLLAGDRLLGDPYHYRDERRAEAVARSEALVARPALYEASGLQFLPFNTVYQLAAEPPELLGLADRLLLIPDLLGFWLTGRAFTERTNASTTGLLDVSTREWNDALFGALGLKRSLVSDLVDPGTLVGTVQGQAREVLGRSADLAVHAVGSHDTASAVVGVPATSDRFAYISCGTWSLVGVELEKPVVTEEARVAGFTNEGGVDGTIRFLHNVMGLWLLSECVRRWEAGGAPVDLGDLLGEAERLDRSAPVAVFDPDDQRFLAPGDMPARIAQYCAEHGLPVPDGPAATTRSILQSLATAFARTVTRAAELSGRDVDAVHLVGGGAQNRLLCQLTADLTGLPVVAGPVEATALGNGLVQARALGAVSGGLAELRRLVTDSSDLVTYTPSR